MSAAIEGGARLGEREAPGEERASRHRGLAPEPAHCDEVVDRRDASGGDHGQPRLHDIPKEVDVGSRERPVARDG